MNPHPVVTAAQMRDAEAALIARGTSADTLMACAGTAIAEAAIRFAGAADALVLCGPGNNGGDGYVAAREMAAAGVRVSVAASAPPATPAAQAARAGWTGSVERLEEARPAPLLIDALFGTGLKRPLEQSVIERLFRLAGGARVTVAVDLPSGVSSDDGIILSPVPAFELTIALGALKPSHLLRPAAGLMGRIVVADIGVPVAGTLTRIARPHLPPPPADAHKYTRGLVAIVAGTMPGAARLAALGAARAGAGYVQLFDGEAGHALFSAIVVRDPDTVGLADAMADERVGALVVGPGLGRHADARRLVDMALASGRPLVLDADALRRLDGARVAAPAILTPHEGEFVQLFGDLPGTKVDRVRHAAETADAVVVLKGADTVVAAPDGRAAIASAGSFDLATAGTGDVLAGVCGTMLAQLRDPFAAACAAVWLHGAASHAVAGPFVADDLVAALPAVVARCR